MSVCMQDFGKTTLQSICHLHYSVITPTFCNDLTICFVFNILATPLRQIFFLTLNVLLICSLHVFYIKLYQNRYKAIIHTIDVDDFFKLSINMQTLSNYFKKIYHFCLGPIFYKNGM